VHDLAVGGSRLPHDARETTAANLEVGDADGVLIRHPERQIARGLFEYEIIARIDVANRFQPIQVLGRISFVLVVGEPLDPGDQDLMGYSRIRLLDPARERSEPWSYARRRRGGDRSRPVAVFRGGEARGKCGATRCHANAAPVNGLFELPALERQRVCCRERAEQGRADDTLVVFGDSGEVAAHAQARRLLRPFEQRGGVDAPVR